MSRSWKLSVVALGTVALVGCGAAPDVFTDGDGVGPYGADVDEVTDHDSDLGATADDPELGDAPMGAVSELAPAVDHPVAPTASCWYEFGDPSCSDARLGTELVRIGKKMTSGQYEVGEGDAMVEVVVSDDKTMIGFISTEPMDGIIVKAGPGALVCKYPQSTFSDAELVAQVDNIPDQLHPVHRVSFCDLTFSKVDEPLDPS